MLLRRSRCELRLNFEEFVRIGVERTRARPLLAGLGFPPHAQIDVAEMILDGGIIRLERSRPLDLLERFLRVAEPKIGPAQ